MYFKPASYPSIVISVGFLLLKEKTAFDMYPIQDSRGTPYPVLEVKARVGYPGVPTTSIPMGPISFDHKMT